MQARWLCLAAAWLFLAVSSASAATVSFAGRTWQVSDRYGAPGPCLFSNACVWVDGSGWLHLEIRKIGTNWCSAEVQTTNTLGYGEYRWYVANRVDDLDTNAVGGLFTYQYVPGGDNEIDFEFTKSFTDDPATNLHYTIQPYYASGHQYQKAMALTNENTTHRFIWNPGYIRWDSWYGHTPAPPDDYRIGSWTYMSNDVPVHSNEHCFINLWMFLGLSPVETTSNKLQMIVKDFAFTPSTNTLLVDEFADTAMSNIWATFGTTTGGRLTETNDTLRANPVDEDYTALGYRTTNLLAWAADGLQYVFSACLQTVEVTTASTNGSIDLCSLQTFFNALSTNIHDSYWASNGVSLKGGYDGANDSLRLELYTKTGWPQNWGNLRFSGTITNVSAFANTNGLELQFVLESTNYRVRAWYLTNAVPVTTNSGASVGLHNLGSALYSGCYAIGAQNEHDGRGVLSWNRTRVFTDTGSYTAAPPPAVTNPPNVVQVGTNTTTWRYPLDTKYKKSRTQVLYRSDQLGQSGSITQMDLYVAGKPRIPMSNFTVRLKHTSAAVQSNRWADAAGWTTGFQATVTINSEGWYAIPLAAAFDYTTASNLLVDFSVNNTKTKFPYAYVRYSDTAATQLLARSAGAGDPLAWTGTEPASPDEEALAACVVNARFYFAEAAPAAPFELRDEFDDTSKDAAWEYAGNWGGAVILESNGALHVRGADTATWDTSGYVSAAPETWSDAAGLWYVFSAVLRTVKVDYARGGEDVRAVLSFCSEKNNAWYVTNALMMQGRYDADSNRLDVVFFTKTNAPSSDGAERFSGALTNASSYLGATNGIAIRILLGNGQYALRFCDGAGQPLPVTTNSGSSTGSHNLGSKLYTGYWLVGLQNYVTNHGSVYWDRTALATSTVPSSALSFAGQTSTGGQGLVTISNAFYDAEGDAGRIRVEATTNGGSGWFAPVVTAVSGTYTASLAGSQGAFQVLRVATTNGSGVGTNRLSITWDTQHAGNPVNLSGLVCTNVRIRLLPDDHGLEGAAVTSAAFLVDNAAPSAAGASVAVEGGAAYTLNATLGAAWSGFTDFSGIAGYYLSLTNGGGTEGGSWTSASSGVVASVPDATNVVHVWGRDVYGNLGAAASDAILALSPAGDWDGDGMPNGWEVEEGLGPTNSSDAGEQGDSDPYPNRDEYYWGTDPNSGGSCLSFEGEAGAAPTNCVLTWSSVTGRLYSLYRAGGTCSNGMPWMPMASFSNVAGVQGLMTYTDQNPAAEGRYYRLRVKLP